MRTLILSICLLSLGAYAQNKVVFFEDFENVSLTNSLGLPILRPNNEIKIRDPFVLVDKKTKKYYIHANGGGKTIVYVSSDLQSWQRMNIPSFKPNVDYWGTKDFWAPDVYLYNDKYYMFITVSSDTQKRGNSILVSEDPLGPFIPLKNESITPSNWMCLDASLYVDEAGDPWMIYCHEWLETIDGRMYAQKLTEELDETIGEPIFLFSASEAPWTKTIKSQQTGVTGYVTDAPFIYRTEQGHLIMLWSSFGKNGYAIGQTISYSGDIQGPWVHDSNTLNSDQGGHAMVFRDFEGNLKISYHSPNSNGHLTIQNLLLVNGKFKIVTDNVNHPTDPPYEAGNKDEIYIGSILTKNYPNGGGAVWDVQLERGNPISGSKSAYFNIDNTGTENFALQFRLNQLFSVKKDYSYRVSFKTRSSTPNQILLRAQVTAPNLVDTIYLNGNNEIQEHSTIFKMNKTASNPVIFIAFGHPTLKGKIWLDDFKIEELDPSSSLEILDFENIKIKAIAGQLRISSPETLQLKVFNLSGQKIVESPLNLGVSTIDIPKDDKLVFVKLYTQNNISRVYKIKMYNNAFGSVYR